MDLGWIIGSDNLNDKLNLYYSQLMADLPEITDILVVLDIIVHRIGSLKKLIYVNSVQRNSNNSSMARHRYSPILPLYHLSPLHPLSVVGQFVNQKIMYMRMDHYLYSVCNPRIVLPAVTLPVAIRSRTPCCLFQVERDALIVVMN